MHSYIYRNQNRQIPPSRLEKTPRYMAYLTNKRELSFTQAFHNALNEIFFLLKEPLVLNRAFSLHTVLVYTKQTQNKNRCKKNQNKWLQKFCSSGIFWYRSKVSGFEKAPRCSTSFPAIICFTATSTFFPFIVYWKTKPAMIKLHFSCSSFMEIFMNTPPIPEPNQNLAHCLPFCYTWGTRIFLLQITLRVSWIQRRVYTWY